MNKKIWFSLFFGFLYSCIVVTSPNKENRKVPSSNTSTFIFEIGIKHRTQEAFEQDKLKIEEKYANSHRLRQIIRDKENAILASREARAIHAERDAREKAAYEAYEREKKARAARENCCFDDDDYDSAKVEEALRSLETMQQEELNRQQTQQKMHEQKSLRRNSLSTSNNLCEMTEFPVEKKELKINKKQVRFAPEVIHEEKEIEFVQKRGQLLRRQIIHQGMNTLNSSLMFDPRSEFAQSRSHYNIQGPSRAFRALSDDDAIEDFILDQLHLEDDSY